MALVNPYIAGRALGDDSCFFGREDILHLVETEMRNRDRNAVVLFGQRRIGKTSILKQLEQRLIDGLVVVRFDLFEYTSKPLGRMLSGIVETVAERLNIKLPTAETFDDEGKYFRQTFLPAVYHALGANRRLILLFDEFDVLDMDIAQPSPNNGEHAFFSFLRKLMEDEAALGFVIVIGRKFEDLTLPARSAFRLGARYKRVSVLDEPSARKLVRLAETQGSLTLSAAVEDRILELTAGHPYFTQLVCRILFDRAYERPLLEKGLPQVDTRDVDIAAEEALESGHNVFSWIWDGLPPAERVVLAAIATATESSSVVTKDQILQILQEHGARILVRELELAPETLVGWELLAETQGGYRFFVELLRLWIMQNKPILRVKAELDSTVLLANFLYQSGKGFFERGQWEQAEQQFRQTLRENPNHIKAHIFLGESLHRLGRMEEAETQLEREALPLDHDQTRFSLVRVLLDRGSQLTRQGQLDAALSKYRRVLELSPREKVAREHSQALLAELGQQALGRGQHEKARSYFKAAGQAGVERQALWAHAEVKKAEEEFDSAITLLQELLQIVPTDEERQRAQDALHRCEQARQMQLAYQEGKSAYEQGDYLRAMAQLTNVIQLNPNYKEAASLLWGTAQLLATAQGQPPPASMQRQIRRRQFLVLVVGLLLGGAIAHGVRWLAMHSWSTTPVRPSSLWLNSGRTNQITMEGVSTSNLLPTALPSFTYSSPDQAQEIPPAIPDSMQHRVH